MIYVLVNAAGSPIVGRIECYGTCSECEDDEVDVVAEAPAVLAFATELEARDAGQAYPGAYVKVFAAVP